ncbi:nitrate- and nitrite sensing domain-containing protein [Streptomyces sp. TR02-1]|uniref:sensor histidine kinase n=1 Tax=Streptomyces sp. TR02-1 TaxID=3385977 RepID=UPI0039A10F00
MRFRGKSIRRKIVALLLVPLVSLVSIWAFASYLTGREAAQLLSAERSIERVDGPTLDIVDTLQRERREVMVYLADTGRAEALSRFHWRQRATDKAVDRLRDAVGDGTARSDLQDDAGNRLEHLLDGLHSLDEIRRRAESGALTRDAAFRAYNGLVGPCFGLLTSLHGGQQQDLQREGQALVGVARAREYLAREDALLAAAIVAGTMPRDQRRAFSDRIAERELSLDTSLQQLPTDQRGPFRTFRKGSDMGTLRAYEDTVLDSGSDSAAREVGAAPWKETTAAVLDELRTLRAQAEARYRERAAPVGTEVWLRFGAAGLLGLAAVLASLIISVRVARGLIRDLSTLRKQANEAAGFRLPGVMRRLAAGEQVDVETEAPRLEFPPDETGQVGQALNTLQRAAVEAAVKQADMRRGVSEVFVNLARRNQVLLHRQLTLLDAMERRTEDADELADLFRLDHMTTRMRRHAEGLVILSGAAPSRQWRKPVQLMDVARAAVAEVEDYERIEVRRLARLSVDGSAVADLTHLIAELLENATVFSPPHTAVHVVGETVANGFTLEIHDRGLGMPSEALLDANLRLAEMPEFELSDTDRLGLFVVARLAQRHGVRVSLQPSPYGGTTAVVLIPGALLHEPTGDEGGAEDATPGPTRPSARRSDRRRHEDRTPEPLDGPVELDMALGDLEPPDRGDGLFRQPTASEGPGTGRPEQEAAPEQHRQAGGAASFARTAHRDERIQDLPHTTSGLPRRRAAPVLVTDHGRRVEQTENDAGGVEPPAEGSAPDRSAGADASPGPEADTVGGLPRRVRQASLAPQLKEAVRQDGTERGDASAPESHERDADEARRRMASLQRGWQRGRHQNDTGPDSPAGTAQRTNPEGEGR